jgi:hypothetical protein
MDKDSLLERGKYWGFASVSTIGWLVLSVFAFQLSFALFFGLMAVQSVISQLIHLFGLHTEVNFLRTLCPVSKALLIRLLDIAKIRRPAGFVMKRDVNPFIVLRIVWWELAKPNRVTFIAGCLVPLLAAIIWIDSPYSPWSDHDLSHYHHYDLPDTEDRD